MMVDFFKNKRNTKEEGFTLIEMASVVMLIGILAAIAIPAYNNQQRKAHNAQVKSDVTATVANVKSWQRNQDTLSPIPISSEFTSLITKSNNETIITLVTSPDPAMGREAWCVQGTSTKGGETFKTYYNVQTKTAGEGTCPPFITQSEEVYN